MSSMNVCSDAVYLISCLLNDTQPASQRLEAIDLKALYAFTQEHSLAGITAFALEHAGIHDGAFTWAKGQAVRKAVMLGMDRENVLRELESAGIWYMLLKGSVLMDYYPAVGMREAADCDILIDGSRAYDVKAIMQGLGFKVEEFGEFHNDEYLKPPLSNFEMHRVLFSDTREAKLCEYYADTKSRLLKDEGNNYGWHFSNEDFYVYMTAHEYKHYRLGGTGLRSLVDVYVFLKRFSESLDWGYLAGELDTAGLSDFERENRGLAVKLFDGDRLTNGDTLTNGNTQPLTHGERQLLEYIINSGTYGNADNFVRNRMLHSHSQTKTQYILSRIFLPMSEIRDQYPFFYRHKSLIPILIIRRLVRALTKKKHSTLQEIRAILKMQQHSS